VIHISSKSDEAYHYFHISDNGSGIEKMHLAKIFNERQTLDKADRYGNKGTGLGLAKVKSIIEDCDGKINVTSVPNVGTSFKICIPNFIDL
jgi:signal transduction histidine kinase